MSTVFRSCDTVNVCNIAASGRVHILQVDLGVNRNIDEAIWYQANEDWARPYKIECLADGQDPATGTWVTVFDKPSATWPSGGNGGIITDQGRQAGGYSDMHVDGRQHTEPIKFAPQNARYWRAYATNAQGEKITAYEFELHDAAPAGPASGKIGDVKKMGNDTGVVLKGKRITAIGGGLPADVAYIEEPDQSGAIRVQIPGLENKGIGSGDTVNVAGVTGTTNWGEQYISVVAASKTANTRPLDAVGINSKNGAEPPAPGMFVEMWGSVTDVQSDYFEMTDGGSEVKVMCGAVAKPSTGQYVKVRGVVSNDGTGQVLYMRNEPVDWAPADAIMPLPFPGTLKSLRDFLLIGTFGDAGISRTDQLLNHDFLSEASGGAVTETTVRPSVGDACGSKTWFRHDGQDDGWDLLREFGTGAVNCTVYAHVYVYSPVDGYVPICIGSDDAFRMWVNGQEIPELTLDVGRGINYNQNSAAAYVHQGLNSVLMKIVNGTGGYGFVVQFGTWSGTTFTPWDGLGYLLNKEPDFAW